MDGPPSSAISPTIVPLAVMFLALISPGATVIPPVNVPPVAPLILSTVVACPYNFLA